LNHRDISVPDISRLTNPVLHITLDILNNEWKNLVTSLTLFRTHLLLFTCNQDIVLSCLGYNFLLLQNYLPTVLEMDNLKPFSVANYYFYFVVIYIVVLVFRRYSYIYVVVEDAVIKREGANRFNTATFSYLFYQRHMFWSFFMFNCYESQYKCYLFGL
jgi:hypothetical protein